MPHESHRWHRFHVIAYKKNMEQNKNEFLTFEIIFSNSKNAEYHSWSLFGGDENEDWNSLV